VYATTQAALLFGTVITAGLYIIACSTVLMVRPTTQLIGSNATIADSARLFWGAPASLALTIFATMSGFGALHGWI
jgi:amino acid transporter